MKFLISYLPKNSVFLKKNKFIILLFILFIITRSVNLGQDILNTDAERWYRRSENFLNAFRQNNLQDTYQMYHPGVSLMWTTSIISFILFKFQLLFTNNPLTFENSDYFLQIHFLTKFINVFILSILFVFQIFLISKLFNKKTSLIFGIFMVFEPYLIGINRWQHLTSYEVFFGFTSFLCALSFFKNYSKKYLILSAVLLSISILAKVTSVIFGFIITLLFLHQLFYKNDKKVKFTDLILFLFITLLVIFMLFPALWVSTMFVFNKMFSPIFSAITDNPRENHITGLMEYFFYIINLSFKLSPLTLVLFLLSVPYSIKSKDFKIKATVLSIFIYYIFLTLTDQKIDRYSLVFFPYIILLMSNYISQLSNKILCLILSTILIVYGYTFYIYHPVYSAYYSPLFGATKNALNLGVYDNSGEYFAQAALYLKQKPRDTYVYVPNGFSSFNLYYNGLKQTAFDENTNYVVTSYDMQRLDPTFVKCPILEKSFGSKEHDIVFIWKCR